MFGVVVPPISAFRALASADSTNSSTLSGASPSALPVVPSKYPASADAAAGVANSSANLVSNLVGGSDATTLASPSSMPEATFTPHELTGKRTATSSVYQNKDGSLTQTQYAAPHFYKNNGAWDTINTKLVPDNNAADSGNIFGKALGAVESLVGTPNAFTETGNSWLARFTPSDFAGGMVRVKQGDSQVGFSPVGANTVTPTITSDSTGQQTVRYANLWPGVDVTYMVESDQVKEAIVLKDKQAASRVQFKIVGADLQAQASSAAGDAGADAGSGANISAAFNIHGALDNQFGVAPVNLILNKLGYIDNKTSGLSQSYQNGVLSVGLSSNYLQSLPAKAFPAVIDPSIYSSSFGTRSGGNFQSFETNGTTCASTVCDLYAGSLYDSNGYLQYWRSAMAASYTMFQNSGVVLNHANLHLTQLSGVSWWTGTTDTHTYYVGHETCQNNFNCLDSNEWWDSGNVGTSGDIDVTNTYQTLISHGDYTGWLMIGGEDGTTSSFKSFDPNGSYVTFTYSYVPPAPSFVTPVKNQVFVDPQASFRLYPQSNPNGSTPLQYNFRVSSNADGSGLAISSGLVSSTSWTVPDGILQDGSGYYVSAQTYDPTGGGYGSWSSPVAFNIDSREGQDKTQTYDTVGPAQVNLGTGNLETSTSSHTTKALGGDLGVSLDYNSPVRSRAGLAGEYWNVPANYSGTAPTRQADFTRVDQNIDFDWGSGSPAAGINSTWFYARWTGWFVAPTAGSYNFGGSNDDNMTVKVNGAQLYNSAGCGSICFGSSVNLTAGQVVPIEVDYMQGPGLDYAHLYVNGAVAQQVVPQAWLQSGVRPVSQNNGLTGHYYYDDGTHNLDSTTKTQFLSRTDPVVSFNWGAGSPVPGGPNTNFMVRWSGYVTAPVTGSYYFGAASDDGSRVTVNGTNVESNWQAGAYQPTYGSAISLTAGQPVPITVDYFQGPGNDAMYLYAKSADGTTVPEQVVPTSWLSTHAQILPAGWQLGIDPDGSLSYDHLVANANNVVLTDASGDAHTYTWTGSGYQPPVNESGHLTRNNDGSFTLQDSDGRTYVFDTNGILTSVTSPVDDRKPAALQYTYGGTPAHLTKISDGVTASRNAQVYYGGASQCGSSPGGFDAQAPAGMVCAVQTNDGRTTNFYYASGNLARISLPGNENTDYQYDTLGRIVAVRDVTANDAIAAGTRANDASATTQLAYDAIGRVSSVTMPAATAGATPLQQTFDYANTGTVAWRNTTTANDTVAGRPVVVSWGGTRLDAFARGSAGDLIHRWSDDGVTWSAWESLGGCIQGDPSATTWSVGRLDVVVQGCTGSGGNNLYHTWFDGTWHGYELLAANVADSPSMTSWAPGRLDIFGRSASNQLEHMWFDGSWHTPETFAGCIAGAPTATTNTQMRLDIFTQNCNATGNNLARYTFTIAGGWSGQVSMAGTIAGTPSAATTGTDSVQLVAPKGSAISHFTFAQSTGTLTANPDVATCSATAPSLSDYNNTVTMFTRDCAAPTTMHYSQWLSPFGTTSEHIVGAAEPNGYTRRVEYDNLFRTTKDTDVQGLSTTTQWDATRDLQYSSTDPTGLMTSTIYDDEDRPVTTYGAAPASWFTSSTDSFGHVDNVPQAAYASQVPRADTAYDQGLTGLGVAYMAYASASNGLTGAPLLHATNIASDGTISQDFGSTSSPIPNVSSFWGFDMTGKMRLPTVGNYTFRIASDNGVRMWIDNQLVIDDWTAGAFRSHPTYVFNNATANTPHDVHIEYFHQWNDASFMLYTTPPGASETTNLASYFSPDYSLTTSTTAYDATIGNSTSTTNYGANPELGLEASTTTDTGGLNLAATSTYETQGTGFLRQTSTSLPGGATTSYSYYGATDTAANPCVTNSSPAYQAGMAHVTTDPTGITTTNVYDDAGNVVAARTNSDPWTCTTYDARGRVTETDIPSVNGQPARTVTHNYAVGGNPLVTSVTDAQGTVTTTTDLLGRTVTYTDVYGKTTNTTYDNLGRISGDTGPLGTEVYTYNNYGQLTNQQLNGTSVAQLSYDQYARLNQIVYPTAHVTENIGFDTLGNTASQSFTLANSSVVSDTATYSQSKQILTDAIAASGATTTWNYTYDKANRLTGATSAANTYSYGFGTERGSCPTGTNANASADSNRTSMTHNGATTTYCYNNADQLTTSSDPTLTNAQYDNHGNTTSLGSTGNQTTFGYDSSDRNTSVTQGTKSTTYVRDATDRIVSRAVTISGATTTTHYGFSGTGDTPDFAMDASNNAMEDYLTLPGDLNLTIRPAGSGAAAATASLANIHGDTMATVDAAGALTGTFQYDPFGNLLSGSLPSNTTNAATFGYEGQHQKETETSFTLQPIQMGARVYIPSLGRFLQTDPIPGGTPNAYVYPADPVNDADLTGMLAQRGRQSRSAPRLSKAQEDILEKLKRGEALTKVERKQSKQILKTANSTIQKFNLERASRETKDMIGRTTSAASKAANKFFFYPIPLPKSVRDALELRSYGPPA